MAAFRFLNKEIERLLFESIINSSIPLNTKGMAIHPVQEFINQGISHLEGMTSDKKLIKSLRSEETIAINTLKDKQK